MRAQPIRLSSAPKCDERSGQHRTVSARATWKRLRPLLGAIGITRLADITGLDRLGIPTFSCVRPAAARFGVTVTCGKGLRGIDAMVGAVMETVEYKLSEPSEARGVVARMAELDGPCVDPRDLIVPAWVRDVASNRYEWVEGWDIARDEAVWVPAAAVYSEDGRGDFLFSTNTNGLASGNRLEEAICHALAELIERDACSIARSHLFAGTAEGRYPSIAVDSLPPVCRAVAGRFLEQGIELYLRNFTSDLGIACVDVACLELHSGAFLLHGGSGAHLVAEIAMLRALTEAAQSRAADIQGSREDLSVIRRRAMKEVNRDSWLLRHEDPVPLASLPDTRTGDVRDDIAIMMGRLREKGMDRVVVVDFTDDLGIPTAKVIVPGLEICEVDRYRLGRRLAPKVLEAAEGAL
ncbi:YcaO-like family protein [Sorangium sp. So ce1128]